MELMRQGAMMTVLSALLTALAWPATLLAATSFIDSTWSIAVDRFNLLFNFVKVLGCGKADLSSCFILLICTMQYFRCLAVVLMGCIFWFQVLDVVSD